MTNEEAIYCMMSYLPDDRIEHCINCPYYGCNKIDEQISLCKSSEAHRMAIKALEQQPCEDAISKQAMFEILTKYNLEMSKIAEDMNKLPPAVPQQKYGKWILADEQNKEDVENDNYRFICSECQCSDIHAKGTIVPYCWKCGAKMQESEE